MTLAVYSKIGWVTVGIGVAVLALSPFVKKLMHLDTLRDEDPLAGREEIAEPQAPGLFPQSETAPRNA
jgi:proton-dependent oligopeptide transporter, POT family